MKKCCCMLIMLLMPIIVHANSGPSPETYEVIVTKPEGTVLYDWDLLNNISIIPYNTVLEITGEYIINNNWYGYVDWKETSGFIKLNDTAINKNYSLDKAQAQKGQIYTYKEVNMYAGPSQKFDILTSIPANIILNYTYLSSYNTWCFTTYNGQSGWVNIENTIYDDENEDIYMTGVATINDNPNYKIMLQTSTITLYNLPTYNSTSKSITILPNTLVEPIYYATAEHYMYNWCYISINGVNGWIEESQDNLPVIKDAGHFITVSDELIIRSLNNLTTSTIKVKPNTKLEYEYKSNYFYDEMTLYYIKYNNEYYWINKFDGTAAIYQIGQYQVKAPNGLEIKESPDEKSKSLNVTIPYDKIFSSIYYYEQNSLNQNWIYTNYEGTTGWVNANINNVVEINIPETDTGTNNENVVENNKNNANEEITNTNIKLTPKLIVALCILGVLTISIIALIILLFINRKKSKNNVSNV